MASAGRTQVGATGSRPSDRYLLLDGLRGLAAVAIVVHHFTENSGHTEVFASASIAVDFFFCLSGFVIAYAYHGRLRRGMTLGEYATKRLVRLYPMYFMGTLLGLAAILLLKNRGLTDLGSESLAAASALNLLYLPYFNSHYVEVFSNRLVGVIFPLNNPAWSLFFGVLANMLYAATIRSSTKAPLALLCVSAVGLCFAAAIYGEAPGWGTKNFLGGFPRVLFSFFAGVVLFQLHHRTRFLPRWNPAYLVVLIIVLLAIPRFVGHKTYWLLMVLAVVPLLVATASWCVIEERSFWHKLCNYSARLSYPIFCIHYPMLKLWSVFPVDGAHFIWLSLAFFASTMLVSHVVMTYIEEPVRSWLSAHLAPT